MAIANIIVIGGSAGALPVFQNIVADLPADIPAAIFVVSHLPSNLPSRLPNILNREAGPRVIAATDGAVIQPSTIYVAPPDRHLLIAEGHVQLTRGPRENHVRPAIDPLFRSAAKEHGDKVIAVLLSGVLDDGVAGLHEVKRNGGRVLVIDRNEYLLHQLMVDELLYDNTSLTLRTHTCVNTGNQTR